VSDATGYPIGHSGDDHPPIAMAHEDHVLQFLELKNVDDVGNVRFEVDLG